MNALRILLLAMAAIGTAAGAASEDHPAAYSHVIPVTVSGRQAVVQLPLPRAVYLEARYGDLRDVRLFDAGGTSLPFALVERVRDDAVAHSKTPVGVFPVRAHAGANAQDSLQIRTRDDGTLVSVRAPARDGGEVLTSLILDLQPPASTGRNAAGSAVAALELAPPAGESSYSARVTLETSDDLQHWTPVTDAALSWLVNSQGARVQKNRIAFAPRAFRYARIAWLEGKPAEFTAATADWVTPLQAPAQWESVVLQPTPGRSGDLVYAAPVAIPAESVGLVFQGQNVVLPATIGWYRVTSNLQARGQGADVEPVAVATFYQLTQNGQRRVSGDVAVPVTHPGQWVLRPQAKMAEQPGLRLRWRPETIVFLAGGRGPYTLAFGRNGAQPAWLPLDQVAPGFSRAELAALETAKAGTPVKQHEAESGSATTASNPAIWLWALLLCGVAALALMAWRLVRQLNATPSDQPPA